MAGDWIIWRKGLVLKPKIALLADLLGVTDLHAAAAVMLVQEWLDSNLGRIDVDSEGNAFVTMKSSPVLRLDAISLTPGMGKALLEVGWLSVEKGVWRFFHAGEHGGQTAKDRALTQKRMGNLRARKCNENVTIKSSPEKRREYTKKKKSTSSSAQPAVASVSDDPKPATARPRNLIFDTLREIAGYPEKVSARQGKEIGLVAAELQAIGATPDEIHRRWAGMLAKWPDGKLTVHCIPKQWANFSPENAATGTPVISIALPADVVENEKRFREKNELTRQAEDVF